MTGLNDGKIPVPRRTNTPEEKVETGDPLPLAAAAVEAKRWQEAMEHAQAATVLDSKSFEAWVLLGIAKARLKDLREAVLCFQRALEQRPDDLQTWVDLGEVCLGINDFHRAGKALGRAIELDPNAEHPAGRRARALAGRAIIRLRSNK
jgi:Flp pilus assembly protein TadD